MQSLFALHQCREADYELAQDFISERFQPDLNSMEVQDKALLTSQKKEAQQVFRQSVEGTSDVATPEDAKIKKAVEDAIRQYRQQCRKDTEFFKKNLVVEIESIYDRYIAVLSLARAFAEMALTDKKVSHANFIQNAWMKALHESEELAKEMKRLSFSWDSQADKVRQWFRDVVRQDSEYLTYLDKRSPSVDDQKKFTNHLFKKIILGENNINDYFEEEVLRWVEDKEIVKGLVEKTVKSYHPDEQEQISLHTLSVNWEEDSDFIEKLYVTAADQEPQYTELIAKNTRNWEIDRLPLTDRVILDMAIAEMLSFPNIPVKVTINEYIELTKDYSTPKSRQFINGILDVIAKDLSDKGLIKKSGRGLIDNK